MSEDAREVLIGQNSPFCPGRSNESQTPGLGDMVLILDTPNTRECFPDGIGKKFSVESESLDHFGCPQYQISGGRVTLSEKDVQIFSRLVTTAAKVFVKSRIECPGRSPLVPGLQGVVLQMDDHGALICFHESGVRWKHHITKQNYTRLQSVVPLDLLTLQGGQPVVVTGRISSRGRTTLAPGMRGRVVTIDDLGAFVHFEQSGVEWTHYIDKDHFLCLATDLAQAPPDSCSTLKVFM